MRENRIDVPKIVILTFESLTANSAGGIGKISFALSEYLHSKGYDVTFYTINKGPFQTAFVSEAVHWSSRYFLFILNFLAKNKLVWGVFKRRVEEWYFDFFLSRKSLAGNYLISTHAYLPRTLKRHAHKFKTVNYIPATPNPETIFEIYTKELSKIQRGKEYHDAYTDEHRLQAFRQSIPFFTKIISFTPVSTRSFQGLPCKVVEVPFIYVPSRQEEVRESSGLTHSKIIFFYIAHTVLLKGLHLLLEEWQIANLSNAELHIGGSVDDQYQTLFALDFSKYKNVKYVGRIENLSAYFLKTSFVLIPSLIDNEPSTVTEALVLGRPVILSTGCGYADFVGEQVPEGIFDINRTGQLADKLRKIADNPVIFAAKYDNLIALVQQKQFDYNVFFEKVVSEAVSI